MCYEYLLTDTVICYTINTSLHTVCGVYMYSFEIVMTNVTLYQTVLHEQFKPGENYVASSYVIRGHYKILLR
jgi:hypothetical protein